MQKNRIMEERNNSAQIAYTVMLHVIEQYTNTRVDKEIFCNKESDGNTVINFQNTSSQKYIGTQSENNNICSCKSTSK